MPCRLLGAGDSGDSKLLIHKPDIQQKNNLFEPVKSFIDINEETSSLFQQTELSFQ